MFFPVNAVINPLTNYGTRFESEITNGWSFDRVTEGEWNLRWFGAKGDGVNDHANVADAVAVAGAAGKSLYVPPGDYALTNEISLPDNFVLHGSGVKSKIMLQTGLTVNTLGVLHVDGQTNVMIRDLHIAQNGYHTTTNATTGNFTGIYLRNADHCTIQDCVITGYAGQGILIQTSDHARVLRNKFPDPGHVDSFEKQAQVQDIRLFDSSYCLMEGNECFSLGEHPGESGISLYGGWTEHAGGLGGGAAISSEYNVVRGNVVKRKTQYGIECYSFKFLNTNETVNESTIRATIIADNYIENIDGSYHHVSESADYSDITLASSAGTPIYIQTAADCEIVNNTIRNAALYTRGHGFHVKAGITATHSSVVVQDNRLFEVWYDGIHVNNSGGYGDGDHDFPKVKGNTVAQYGAYFGMGSITAGDTNLTLVNPAPAPLSAEQQDRGHGGFWVGDEIVIAGAGAAGADHVAEITSLTAGVFGLDVAAVSTVSEEQVNLAQSSSTPPGSRAGIFVVQAPKPVVTDNAIYLTGGHQNMQIRGMDLQGKSGTPIQSAQITGNYILGGYYSIRLTYLHSPSVQNNTIGGQTSLGIYGVIDIEDALIRGNSLRGGTGIGIQITSTGGAIEDNVIASVPTGITKTGSILLGDNRIEGAATEFTGGQTPIGALASGSSPNVDGQRVWKAASAGTITGLLGGNIGDVKRILIQAAVGFTHSVGLKLLNAADAALASGDSIDFVKTAGGVWEELGRNTQFSTSAALAGLLGDETGTGAAVFATAPVLGGTATMLGVQFTRNPVSGIEESLNFGLGPSLFTDITGPSTMCRIHGVSSTNDGKIHLLKNAGTGDIWLMHESPHGSVVNERKFSISTGSNLLIAPSDSALIIYDPAVARWKIASGGKTRMQINGTLLALEQFLNISGNLTASDTGTNITVALADDVTLNGRFAQPVQGVGGSEIDWSTGNIFSKSLSGNTTFTFTSPTAGQWITVKVTATGPYTVTWPSAAWKGGSAPTQTAGQTDFYRFLYDGSTYWAEASQNF